METKTYTFNGTEYTQSCLTIGQTKRLMKLSDGISLENFSASKLAELLFDKMLLDDFLSIILKTDGDFKLDIDNLLLQQVIEVIEDFFCLNDIQGLLSKIFSGMNKINTEVLGAEKQIQTGIG